MKEILNENDGPNNEGMTLFLYLSDSDGEFIPEEWELL